MSETSESGKQATPEPSKKSPVEAPLIFISHDSRDADLAEAFANLLLDASGGILKSFRSSDRKGTAGIEFGAEWYRTIMDRLGSATDVVALLTEKSLDRPWILYETGVAKGKLDTTVLGLALGVQMERVATGPFAQFQNSDDDEDSITKLVLQLIKRHPQAAPREEAVRRQVQAFLGDIKELLAKRATDGTGAAEAVGKPDDNSVVKLFEEVKVLVRSMPERVVGELEERPSRKRRHLRSPGDISMIFDMTRHVADVDPGFSILVLLSMIREDFPWLYDMGADAARAMADGSRRESMHAIRRLRRGLELLTETPMSQLVGSRREYEILHYVQHLLGHPTLFSSAAALSEEDEPADGKKTEMSS